MSRSGSSGVEVSLTTATMLGATPALLRGRSAIATACLGLAPIVRPGLVLFLALGDPQLYVAHKETSAHYTICHCDQAAMQALARPAAPPTSEPAEPRGAEGAPTRDLHIPMEAH